MINRNVTCSVEFLNKSLCRENFVPTYNLNDIIIFQISTIFWWDNFDRNVETALGSGSVHTTAGVAFQEEGDCSKIRNEEIGIPKSNRKSIQLTKETDSACATIKSPSFAGLSINEENTGADIKCALNIW